MNISYNWLKEYVNFDLTPDEVAEALTSIGLETGGVEEVQTIKGGLEAYCHRRSADLRTSSQFRPHACYYCEFGTRRTGTDCLWSC